MSTAWKGFFRGVCVIGLEGVLSYIGVAGHLDGIVSAGLAAVVASGALALEHWVEAQTGYALFGAISPRR